MENATRFRAKLESGHRIPLGCGVTFSDPTVTELISHTLDFAFIDMEHNAHSLETPFRVTSWRQRVATPRRWCVLHGMMPS